MALIMNSIIALSQRVEVDPRTNERRDCLDQNWAPFFESIGYTILPMPNVLRNPIEWFHSYNCSGLILSGGNDLSHLPNARHIAPERDNTEMALVGECLRQQIPVIGVCRGLQMINHIFGGTQKPCQGHAGLRHALHFAENVDDIWKQVEVNSFHDWGISLEDLADGLKPLCFSDDGMVEAFEGVDHAIWGLMWHPEREIPKTNFDKNIFNMMLGHKIK